MLSALRPKPLPNAETAYMEQVVQILRKRLGERLAGIYLFGSGASGDYVPGVSDLDVQAVAVHSIQKRERHEIARSLSHDALPCPARRLEFVCYTKSAVCPATRHPQFELNLNTGANERDHLSLDPGEEPSHWFLLDIAMGRELGRSLMGPPPAQAFSPIPRLWQLEAIADSLAWHQEHEPTSANTVLTACRGWQYAVTGESGSKLAGAAWVSQEIGCLDVVEQAKQYQQEGLRFSASDLTAIIERVTEAVRTAILREERSRPT